MSDRGRVLVWMRDGDTLLPYGHKSLIEVRKDSTLAARGTLDHDPNEC